MLVLYCVFWLIFVWALVCLLDLVWAGVSVLRDCCILVLLPLFVWLVWT